jgi:hypothetical protein
MKQIKCSSILVTLLLVGSIAYSQRGTVKLEAAYKAAIPLGNFKNITTETSGRGWEAAVLYSITDAASAGLQTGFQDFYQKYDRQVFHGQGSAVSAVVTNSVQVIPLLLKGKYLLTQNSTVQPFASLGIGAALVQYRKYYGQFADSRSKVGFAAQPEIGVHIPVGRYKRAGIQVAAGYNYIPYKASDANGLHHASVKAGVAIPLR